MSDSPATVTVLVADDQDHDRERAAGALERAGYRVLRARDGQEALARQRAEAPDLLVLDLEMPGLSGLDVVRVIKSDGGEDFVPVLLATARHDVASRVRGLRMGADDYLIKPYDPDELVARAEALLRVKRLHEEVRRKKAELEELSLTDSLTGLANHRYLTRRLAEEFQRAERYREALACLVIDLDEFKTANDRFGHPFGDRLLRAAAEAMRRCVRSVDVVTRYGGDEFVLLLPNTQTAGALAVAERLRRDIAACELVEGGARFHTTASVGVSFFPGHGITTQDELLRAADQALYRAKELGRDRVCLAGD